MIVISDKEMCTGCNACYSICPEHCISMLTDNEGFQYPKVDNDKCTDCGLCESVCPLLNSDYADNNSIGYAAFNKNVKIRENSSSGGLFTIFAEYIIDKSGYIFGAGFDTDFNVIHKYTDNYNGLKELRDSKYTQSDIGKTFLTVKHFLKQGKYVLFTGTPCQVAGLKSFLDQDYDKLICIDFICHGVPSPLVWNRYIHENFNYKNINSIDFRNKEQGWRKFSLKLMFNNGNNFIQNLTDNLFLKGFLTNLYLRPSCYNCKFKKANYFSDITMADFWGIENICIEMDDNMGTSLILLNSKKGHTLFKSVKYQLKYQIIDLHKALSYNKAATKSAFRNSNRDSFFKELQIENSSINELIYKFTQLNSITKLKNKFRVLLRKTIRRFV